MHRLEPACLMRIFVNESDRFEGRPLYEAIVEGARSLHLAGATVLRGPMGYGAHSRVHTTRILRLSEDLPMVVEIVDTREKIDEFLPRLEQMMPSEGLVTLEVVEVVRFGDSGDEPAEESDD